MPNLSNIKKWLPLLAMFIFNIIWLLLIIFIYNIYHLYTQDETVFPTWFPNYHGTFTFISKNVSFTIGLFIIIFLFFNFFCFKKWSAYLWKKEVGVALFSTLIALGGAEWCLRKAGFVPGQFYDLWYKKVDNLNLLKGFETDSLGIFKISEDAGRDISNYISSQLAANSTETNCRIAPDEVGEIYNLKYHFSTIHSDPNFNAFSKFIDNLKNKPTDSIDQFEQAVLKYSISPINKDGFKSIAFRNYPSGRKKILLLGDSFTWGHSAPNITSSFADILLSKDYIIYNSGISGADPSQYLAIAKEYIPLIKPDVVIVNFFMGNDVFYFNRSVLPYQPIFIPTNAGNLMTCPNGKYLNSPEAIYHLSEIQNQIPLNGNIFNAICARSVISTFGWQVLNKFSLTFLYEPDLVKYWKEVLEYKMATPAANTQIKEISNLASFYKASFYLSIIPERKNGRLTSPNEFKNLFTGQNYFIPDKVTIWDYDFKYSHFNKSGHEKYAEHLIQIIENEK